MVAKNEKDRPPITAEKRQKLPPPEAPELVASETRNLKTKYEFPEWNQQDLQNIDWSTMDAPFEDIQEGATDLPPHIKDEYVEWKRPHEYLPELDGSEADTKTAKPMFPGPQFAHVLLPSKRSSGEKVLRNLPRGFRRVWSDRQLEDFIAWEKEEQRIQDEKDQQAAALAAYEESVRRKAERGEHSDEDISDSELLDDEDDDDPSDMHMGVSSSENLNADDIAPQMSPIRDNCVVRPTIPNGLQVDSVMASHFRTIATFAPAISDDTPFLWEAIYPQDESGIPVYNPGGKYVVKLFVDGIWRRVDVDDRFPVDPEGRIQILSSSDPTEIWPTILAKALYKVLAKCPYISDLTMIPDAVHVLERSVKAFTGWTGYMWNESLSWDMVSKMIPVGTQVQATDEDPEEEDNTKEGNSEKKLATDSPKKISASARYAIAVCSTESIDDIECRASQGEVFPVAEALQDASDGPTIKLTSDISDFSLSLDEIKSYQMRVVVFYTHRTFEYCDEWFTLSAAKAVDDADLESTQFGPIFMTIDASGSMPSEGDKSYAQAIVSLEAVDLQKSKGLTNSTAPIMLIQDTSSIPATDGGELVYLYGGSYSSIRHLILFGSKQAYRVLKQDSDPYHLRIASECPVKICDAEGCWKDFYGLTTKSSSGTFEAISSNAWDILCRYHVSFQSTDETLSSTLKLLFCFQDDAVSPYAHMHVIDNDNDTTSNDPLLEAQTSAAGNKNGYTVIVSCCCKTNHVPGGKWKLIASSDNESLQELISLPTCSSRFSGVYEPNYHCRCFRDILEVPIDNPSLACTTVRFSTSYSAAVLKLEVFDAETGELLIEQSGQLCVELLRLPIVSTTVVGKETFVRYIIQGSLDSEHWIIPSEFLSRRPFRTNLVNEGSSAQDKVTWYLNLWTNATEPSLTPDVKAENEEDAVRYDWADGDLARENKAALSRAVYLNSDIEATAKLKEGIPEDYQETLQNRKLICEDIQSDIKCSVCERDTCQIEQKLLNREDIDIRKQNQDKKIQEFAAEQERLDEENNQLLVEAQNQQQLNKEKWLNWVSNAMEERSSSWDNREQLRLPAIESQ